MSAAPITAEPGAAPGPNDQGAHGGGRLLGLVRRIIAYGRDLVASLQQQNAPTPSSVIARRFATFNLTLIIARITRGLGIAMALEARLLRRPPTRETQHANPVRPAAPARSRPSRPRAAEPTREEDDAALLRGLPTAEEIAARIRGRKAGAVIVEICRDLGIDTTHPLWPDIWDAIVEYDGSLARMLTTWTYGRRDFVENPPDDLALPPWIEAYGPLAASTGPP